MSETTPMRGLGITVLFWPLLCGCGAAPTSPIGTSTQAAAATSAVSAGPFSVTLGGISDNTTFFFIYVTPGASASSIGSAPAFTCDWRVSAQCKVSLAPGIYAATAITSPHFDASCTDLMVSGAGIEAPLLNTQSYSGGCYALFTIDSRGTPSPWWNAPTMFTEVVSYNPPYQIPFTPPSMVVGYNVAPAGADPIGTFVCGSPQNMTGAWTCAFQLPAGSYLVEVSHACQFLSVQQSGTQTAVPLTRASPYGDSSCYAFFTIDNSGTPGG